MLVVIIVEHKVTYQGMWKMERVERGYGFEEELGVDYKQLRHNGVNKRTKQIANLTLNSVYNKCMLKY